MDYVQIVYLVLALATYPVFRMLVSIRDGLENTHAAMFMTWACAVYPHHGEPYAEVQSLAPFLLLKTIGQIWQVTEVLLITTERILQVSPHAYTILWVFEVPH